MLNKPLNILISGSGIAGSVFAWWMIRAWPSATITIVERAPALRLTGASVDIRSSAVDIIKWMGMEAEIRKHSTHEAGMQWVKANGKPIGTIYASGRTDMQTISSEFEIFRGALAKIFLEPSLDKVELLLDDHVESFSEHEYGVDVTFAKSKETKTYDLLVAADGLWSKIRGQLFNTPPMEQIRDEGMHVCYFTIKKDMLESDKLAKWHSATRGRVTLLRPDPDPAGRTRGNLMCITTKKDVKMKAKLNETLRQGNEAYMQLMEEEFKDVGWVVPEVLQCMRESDDFYCSLFAQTRCPKLCGSRVVLLGDAAYATPGMGTSLAIIGGYVLAGEILRSSGEIQPALEKYESLMKLFVKSQQGDNEMMQILNPQTSLGIAIRDIVMSTLLGLKIDRIAMYVAAMIGFTEKKVAFPEYPWPEGPRKEEK